MAKKPTSNFTGGYDGGIPYRSSGRLEDYFGDGAIGRKQGGANPEHVEVVRRGRRAILEWRAERPGARLELGGADLCEMDLASANLVGAYLRAAKLCGANLRDADFMMANLRRADLKDAVMIGVDLTGTDLSGAELGGAQLALAQCYRTVFGDLDLSAVIGLERINHEGPSIVGVDTLFRSKGKIPEVFLRGAGVPEILIEHLPSLRGTALEFYTCFISFTEADDLFSERLYSDLQGASVRCWRWKEDAKWGGTLMREVDEAIRVYDKLVVILSAASLTAEPVIREMERALQKEQREKREVLFPIRVDDAVF